MVLSFAAVNAQSGYRDGYLITTSDERVEVSILHRDWPSNPTKFRYRLPGTEQVRYGDLTTVKEFGFVEGGLRYRRFTVDLDGSDVRTRFLSESPKPEFRRSTVFLQYLVDGEADLFYYENGNRRYFLYRSGESTPQELISREYLNGTRIVDNTNNFRSQLQQKVSCGVERADLLRVHYRKNSLVDFFTDYNHCRGAAVVRYERFEHRPRVRFAAKVGVERLAGKGLHERGAGVLRYGVEPITAPRLGLEAVVTLPFANRRWALVAEAYYHRIQHQTVAENELIFDYQSVALVGGFRRHIGLGRETSLFLGAAAMYQFPFYSTVTMPRGGAFAPRTPSVSGSNGAYQVSGGLLLFDRYQLELQYTTAQNLIQTSLYRYTSLHTVSLLFAYRLR
ncbi:hypothetical protein [Neolewinella sp.]|uniref:hypothetical protein n=1 Tax=Neolewinella sp. TaxID=2993543 RepID=UPI003B528115